MKNKQSIIGISIIFALIAGFFTLDSLLYDGVKPRNIKENGFQANFYAQENTTNTTAVVFIGGGQWGDYWGVEMAQRGFVGLSLAYTGYEGLPKLPEEIPLEYFEEAFKWLGEQAEVNPEKIIVMGASRNAELALVLASNLPELVSGAIAFSPSSVSWSNTVLPYNSDSLKASWTFRGEDISYVPMDKVVGMDSPLINTLEYWENGLSKEEQVQAASIKVEDIKGPILLFSGKEDQVWPSSRMADMLENRLEIHDFKYPFENIQYEHVGHQISGNPESNSGERRGKMTLQGQTYEYEYGGSNEDDFKAKQDAKKRLFEFIEGI